MANNDTSPDVERTTGEQEPASDEFLRGEIAHAWRDEFDEDLTWGDMVRWLGETGWTPTSSFRTGWNFKVIETSPDGEYFVRSFYSETDALVWIDDYNRMLARRHPHAARNARP